MTSECVFCERVRDDAVWATSDPRVARFEPLNPVTPGHLLFIPRRHITGPQQDPWLAGVTLQAAATYAQSMTPDRPTHWNFIISDGPAATQTIFHLHVHLVPRAYDDGLRLPWTAQRQHPCIWPEPGCTAEATVRYKGAGPDPVYCVAHAGRMDEIDAELGFPGAKQRED